MSASALISVGDLLGFGLLRLLRSRTQPSAAATRIAVYAKPVAAGAACVRLRSSRQILTTNTHPTADNHERVSLVLLVLGWPRHIEQDPSRPPPAEPHDRGNPSATTALAALTPD